MVRRFIVILLLSLSTTVIYGQNKVSLTGHITAEIIEGVAITPNMENDVELNDQSTTINLGEISLASDQDIACNVILNSGDLENAAFESFTDEEEDSIKILRFSANAKNLRGQKNGIYKGSYSVMLMYE